MGSVLENKTVAMRIPCGSLTPLQVTYKILNLATRMLGFNVKF